jgi:hypothetical protein
MLGRSGIHRYARLTYMKETGVSQLCVPHCFSPANWSSRCASAMDERPADTNWIESILDSREYYDNARFVPFQFLCISPSSPEEQPSCGQCTAKKNPEVCCYCKVKEYVAENSINGMSRRAALHCGNSAVGSRRPAGPRTASRCNTGGGIVGIKF